TLFTGFGQSSPNLDQRQRQQCERIATTEQKHSESVSWIISDLSAYVDRKPDGKFERILKEMESMDVVEHLEQLSGRVRANLSGESISHAEFWSDTLDRWAEELVSPSKCGACSGCKGDSLPPSIVLEVMRILEGEIDLREATRSLEQVRTAMQTAEYQEQAGQLKATQESLLERTENVLLDIEAIPNGSAKFGREIQLITNAGMAMADAARILGRPDTGQEAIAAETEAIEWLLQSKRSNPKGGGGGGGSNPGGGGTGDTDRVALELYGPGSDPHARIEHRGVSQATGSESNQLPEEFRDGLDAFFNAIEDQR
ncbi:MAG: hypothetical protein KDA85_21175, partial [Planctomycetaceae bacterium]|nr:hypothetical protein [Planctomycetaceae bacterium]